MLLNLASKMLNKKLKILLLDHLTGRRRWAHYVQLGKRLSVLVAAIALWFRLCLPSCGPGFESQAHHLRFFQFVLLKL